VQRQPSYPIKLLPYKRLTLEARGGLERLRASWRRRVSGTPVPGEPRGPAARGWCKTTPGRDPGIPISGSRTPPGPRDGVPPPQGAPPGGCPGDRGPGLARALGSQVPGGPLRGPGRPREGGFTSTPRAGAPRYPGSPGSPGSLFSRPGGEISKIGPFGPPPQKPLPGEPRGPGARGWCKTPAGGGRKTPILGKNAQKWPKRGKYPLFRPFSGFEGGSGSPGTPFWGEKGPQDPKKGFLGVPKPGPGRGFTSTPRAGAPRFPGAGVASAVQAPRTRRRGAGEEPPGGGPQAKRRRQAVPGAPPSIQ